MALDSAPGGEQEVKPPAFDYLRPASVAEATDALADRGDDARVLAGGQSLIAMLNMRLLEPQVLIDISRLEALARIEVVDEYVEIGAATTQSELMAWRGLAAQLPLLSRALPFVGHRQTRNRGTVCGSIAHSDPSSELPLCLRVLGGEVVLGSRAGQRIVPAEAFQTGLLSTARAVDEMILAVRFPACRDGAGYAFREVARRHGDFAIVALAAVATRDTVRIGVGGVSDRPEIREWTLAEPAQFDALLNAFAWELGGYDDIHASARYRRELVRRLGGKVIAEAIACRH